ncbi:MAG: hypothetical protein LBI62_00875 [Candidatus Accumulibacter sp.]|jgi:hypothetical protein|nr:hypothetical protein [Accumulibacter sp.]
MTTFEVWRASTQGLGFVWIAASRSPSNDDFEDQGSGIRDQGSEEVTGGFAAAKMLGSHGFASFLGAKRP